MRSSIRFIAFLASVAAVIGLSRARGKRKRLTRERIEQQEKEQRESESVAASSAAWALGLPASALQCRFVGEGCDFRTFKVSFGSGGALLFRFARSIDAARKLSRERVLLPLLAEHLAQEEATAVCMRTQQGPSLPAYSIVSLPCFADADFPRRGRPSSPLGFGAYPFLSGHSLPRAALVLVLPSILGFLDRLQAFPAAQALQAGVPLRHAGSELADLVDEVEELMPVLRTALPVGLLARCTAFLAFCRDPRLAVRLANLVHGGGGQGGGDRRVLIHGDLHLDHILVSCHNEKEALPVNFAGGAAAAGRARDSLAAILDWSDMRVSDPAIELRYLWACTRGSSSGSALVTASSIFDEHFAKGRWRSSGGSNEEDATFSARVRLYGMLTLMMQVAWAQMQLGRGSAEEERAIRGLAAGLDPACDPTAPFSPLGSA